MHPTDFPDPHGPSMTRIMALLSMKALIVGTYFVE
jgi:hypothetical protein